MHGVLVAAAARRGQSGAVTAAAAAARALQRDRADVAPPTRTAAPGADQRLVDRARAGRGGARACCAGAAGARPSGPQGRKHRHPDQQRGQREAAHQQQVGVVPSRPRAPTTTAATTATTPSAPGTRPLVAWNARTVVLGAHPSSSAPALTRIAASLAPTTLCWAGDSHLRTSATPTAPAAGFDDITRSDASLRRFLHGLPGVDQVGAEARAAGSAPGPSRPPPRPTPSTWPSGWST